MCVSADFYTQSHQPVVTKFVLNAYLGPALTASGHQTNLSTVGTGLHLFLSREGMKASRADMRTTSSAKNTLIALYRHVDVRALLDTLAADTMCALFRGLSRLGLTYAG